MPCHDAEAKPFHLQHPANAKHAHSQVERPQKLTLNLGLANTSSLKIGPSAGYNPLTPTPPHIAIPSLKALVLVSQNFQNLVHFVELRS